MNWLKKLFGGKATPARNEGAPLPAPIHPPRTMPLVERRELEAYAKKCEDEAARTGNARLRETARRIRAKLQ